MSPKTIYLDYNATTPLSVEAKEEIKKGLSVYGNPSSPYQLGQDAKEVIEVAREEISAFINATPQSLIFTSGTTESNALVLRSLLQKGSTRQSHLITTAIEHPSTLQSCRLLEGEGLPLSYLPVAADGRIRLEQLESLITEETALISVMMANNETGTIQDIQGVTTIAQKHQIPVHTDASQAVGKIPVDVEELGVDFLSFSAHKLYGPKGIGALYFRSDTSLSPFLVGGSQEKKLRAGTENVLGILGFKGAISSCRQEMPSETERLLRLKDQLITGLQEELPTLSINGTQDHCLAGTLSLCLQDISGESLMMNLDMEGIAISTGSACSTGSLSASHVLLAMGLSEEEALSSIRVSMGRWTTETEITDFSKKLSTIVKRLAAKQSAGT